MNLRKKREGYHDLYTLNRAYGWEHSYIKERIDGTSRDRRARNVIHAPYAEDIPWSLSEFIKEKRTIENGYENTERCYIQDIDYIPHFYYEDTNGNNVDITAFEVQNLEESNTKNEGESTEDFLKRVLNLDPSITVHKRDPFIQVRYVTRSADGKRVFKEFTYTEIEEIKTTHNYSQWIKDKRASIFNKLQHYAEDSILAEMEYGILGRHYTPQSRLSEEALYISVETQLATMEEGESKTKLTEWKTKVTPIIQFWNYFKAYSNKVTEYNLAQDAIGFAQYVEAMPRITKDFTGTEFANLMTELEASIETEKNPPPAEDPLATEGTAEEPATDGGEEEPQADQPAPEPPKITGIKVHTKSPKRKE